MVAYCRRKSTINDGVRNSARCTLLIRLVVAAAVVVVVFGIGADVLMAADGAGDVTRGPGFYFSWIKVLACWLVFLAWVKTTDWVSTDCQVVKLEFLRWNPIVFGVFFGAFLLSVFVIPIFWIAFPLIVLAYVVPLAWYIIYRNARVEHNVRVLTPEHLRYWFATHLNKLGTNIEAEKRDPHEVGPPVKLLAHGGADEQTNNSRLLMARQSPGMLAAREILAEGLTGRASSIVLDYTQQGASMRAMVDGVWIPHATRSREVSDPALEALKLLCGLNHQDRQSRQEGAFVAEYESARLVASFASQGTSTGERVLVQFEDKKVRFQSFEELGLRAKLHEELQQQFSLSQGFILFSAPVSGGLRSTVDVALRTCDRFTREFAALEEENNRYEEVENVPVTTYNASEVQSPAEAMPKFFRTEPNVVVIRDLVDAEMVTLMCEEIEDERLMIGTMRAKDTSEALLRVLALGVAPDEFARSINVVIGQRLVRKLCDSCKVAYAPTPQVLQQLGIPEGRVQAFYRPPQPGTDERREPCEKCGDIGYYGRTAIFELLTVGDNVRRALTTNPKLDVVRQAAKKDGMKSLQEEGVLLVAKGVTSLPELMRVLKQ